MGVEEWMGKRLHRAQILLETEQHQALAEFARHEGRSISAVVRKIVRTWMAERTVGETWRRRWAARKALQGIRENLKGRYHASGSDLITETQTDQVWEQE